MLTEISDDAMYPRWPDGTKMAYVTLDANSEHTPRVSVATMAGATTVDRAEDLGVTIVTNVGGVS